MKFLKKKPKFTYKNVELDLEILKKFREKHSSECKNKEDKLCLICNKSIPDNSFQKVHHLFALSDYDCFIERKMAINMTDGSYHWDCFITTEQGKKFEQSIIKNELSHYPIGYRK